MSPCCIAVNRISKLRHWKASADTSPVASLVNTPVAQIFLWTATVCSLDQLGKWSLCPKAASVRDLCLWPCSQGAAQAEWSNLGISKDNFRTHPRAPMWKIKSKLRNSDYLQIANMIAKYCKVCMVGWTEKAWQSNTFLITGQLSIHSRWPHLLQDTIRLFHLYRCRKPAPTLLVLGPKS